MRELIAEFRSLAVAIAPEISSVPFYTIEQPSDFPSPYKTTAAYTVDGYHIALKDHLESIGAWQSWGPAIVFVDPPTDRLQFLGLALHELSHVLPARVPKEIVEPTARERTDQLVKIAAWAAADPAELQRKPWIGHGASFVRRVLHLHYRTLWAEVAIPFSYLGCAGSQYGLSPWWKYMDVLANEPLRMYGQTFDEIQSTKPPAAFRKLFCEDTARRRTKQGDEVFA